MHRFVKRATRAVHSRTESTSAINGTRLSVGLRFHGAKTRDLHIAAQGRSEISDVFSFIFTNAWNRPWCPFQHGCGHPISLFMVADDPISRVSCSSALRFPARALLQLLTSLPASASLPCVVDSLRAKVLKREWKVLALPVQLKSRIIS